MSDRPDLAHGALLVIHHIAKYGLRNGSIWRELIETIERELGEPRRQPAMVIHIRPRLGESDAFRAGDQATKVLSHDELRDAVAKIRIIAGAALGVECEEGGQ
jgi:hypothetical protein